MSKLFLTGGMGFVGSYVVREALHAGHQVMVFDSFLQYATPHALDHLASPYSRLQDVADQIEVVRGTITNTFALRKALYRFAPEYVIHLASMPLANLAIEAPEEAFDSITRGTSNLLQLLEGLGSLRRFCYISSSMVYGDFQQVPVAEDHPKDPKEAYGALKYCAEIITQSFSRLYGIDYVIVRPTAVYGPYDANRRVLAVFLENALAGRPLVVKGKDTALDFTYVKDTARGILLAATSTDTSHRVYNISRGEGRTLAEAAQLVQEMIPGVRVELHDADKRYPRRGALDISRARRVLGFAPRYSLEQGLEEYLQALSSGNR